MSENKWAKRPMPDKTGCTSVHAGSRYVWNKWRPGIVKDVHKWEWSSSWNGNTKRVLPFWDRTDGMPRSGWRCYHCGKFVWEDPDVIYALKHAYYMGYLPNFTALMKGHQLPKKTYMHYQSDRAFVRGAAISESRYIQNQEDTQ